MGILADSVSGRYRSKGFSVPNRGGHPNAPHWDRAFNTHKERPSRQSATEGRPGPPRTEDAFQWGGSTAQKDAFINLLNAVRSRAPGGWSDNRYEQANHLIGIVYACIRPIATQLQQTEFQLFKRDDSLPDGKRPVTPDDPAERQWCKPYDLVKLLQRPNNRDSWGKLMYRWAQQKWLTGSALTWLVPNQFGVPFEMYSVPTATAIPQPVTNPNFPDGYWRIQPIYPYGPFSSLPTAATAVGALIPARWMLQFSFPHPFLWYDGYSPLSALRLHIDEITSIDTGRWYANKGVMNPPAVVNPTSDGGDAAEPLPESEINRVVAMLESQFQGMDNVGRILFGSPGYKIEPWGQTPDKMMFESGWDQLMNFIAGAFGVTKPVMGMTDDASYSTLFASLKQFSLQTIQPECDDIAAELTHHLAPFFGDDLILEIRSSRINDHEVKKEKMSLLAQNKAITYNELRKEMDLPVTEEPWGEERVGMDESQGGGMPGMEEAPGAEEENSVSEGFPEPPPLEEEEDTEAGAERPSPGPLGAGSLGPRKSLYQQIRKVIANGHYRHK